jgi:hypothetical protein
MSAFVAASGLCPLLWVLSAIAGPSTDAAVIVAQHWMPAAPACTSPGLAHTTATACNVGPVEQPVSYFSLQ